MLRIEITVEGTRPGTPGGNKTRTVISLGNEATSKEYIRHLKKALSAILKTEKGKTKAVCIKISTDKN